MAKAKTTPGEGPGPGPDKGEAPVKVKFLKLWSSDRGVFLPGATAELPQGIAASLVEELVAEEA